MNNPLSLPSKNVSVRHSAFADPLTVIGVLIGLTPVLAGSIFRTYGYHVSPTWAEALRQLDAPFILIELAVVMWARHCGLSYRSVFYRLDRAAQFAIVVFVSSFWISSAFVSTYPAYSLLRASYWLIHIAFGVAIFHLAGTPTRAGLVRSGGALFAGFVLFLPLMTVHLINAPDSNLIREGKIIWSSAIPGCLSVRHFGIWAALVLACASGALYAFNTTRRDQVIVCTMIFLATATLFWSGTRAGVYGMAGALVVLLVTLRRLPSWPALLVASAAALFGILSSELWLPPDYAFGFFRRASVPGAGDMQSVSSGRTILWASMLQAFADSPLFGVGEGAVHWFTDIDGVRQVQPHNSVVQMLSSWGLIACLAAGYLLSRLLLLVHRMARRNAQVIPLMLVIDCLLIMSLADGVLYFSRFIMWFAGGVGLVLAIAVRDGRVTEAPRALLVSSVSKKGVTRPC